MRGCRLVLLTGALALSVAPAWAQTSLQIPLQFDFLNPGARSLSLGGAFVALADDATAGFANPAGLMGLSRMQVSIELRGRRLESPFLERGRLSGVISNQLTDTIQGPVFGKSVDRSAGVGFVSVVVPSQKLPRRWTFAAFRHELVRVDQSFSSNGVFQQDRTEFTSRRDFPQEGQRRIDLTNYGVAGSVAVNDRTFVGASLSVYHFEIDALFRRVDFAGFLGPPIPNVELGRSSQRGSGFSPAPSFGVQHCLRKCEDRATSSTRLGAAFRMGPSFEYDTQDGPDPLRTQTFRSPHMLALGVFREVVWTGHRLALTGEVTYVGYARLEEDYVIDQARGSGLQDQFFVANGLEFHAGVQYTAETWPWVPRFRAGVWSDPNHTVQYRGDDTLQFPTDRVKDELLRVALSTGERVTHVTAGVGLTLGTRLGWNLGVDLAPRSTVVSSSLVINVR